MSHITCDFFSLSSFGTNWRSYSVEGCYQWGQPCLVNRPGVAGAFLQTPLSLIHSFINWLSRWSFVGISSEHLHSQTLRARELKFWEKVHLPSPVMCHLSRGINQIVAINLIVLQAQQLEIIVLLLKPPRIPTWARSPQKTTVVTVRSIFIRITGDPLAYIFLARFFPLKALFPFLSVLFPLPLTNSF